MDVAPRGVEVGQHFFPTLTNFDCYPQINSQKENKEKNN